MGATLAINGLSSSLFLSVEGRAQAFSCECKINQADFNDRMCFLPSKLMKEYSPISSAKIAKSSHQHRIAEKTKKCF